MVRQRVRAGMLAEVRFSTAERDAALKALEPHLADASERDAALQALERIKAESLFDRETRIYAPESRPEIRAELKQVCRAAQALADALEALSEATRDRLTEWVPGAAVLPGEASVWAPMVRPELLQSLSREAGFLAGCASMAGDLLAGEPHAGGRPKDGAALASVAALATVWERFTGSRPPRGNPDRTPWGRFVSVMLPIIGTPGSADYLARAVAETRPSNPPE